MPRLALSATSDRRWPGSSAPLTSWLRRRSAARSITMGGRSGEAFKGGTPVAGWRAAPPWLNSPSVASRVRAHDRRIRVIPILKSSFLFNNLYVWLINRKYGRSTSPFPTHERHTMWLKEQSGRAQDALGAFLGYGVDAFDYMIYTFMIPTLIALWGMTKAQAGYIATGALITSAIGGWLAGILADRYGRVRMLPSHGAVVQRLHLPERLHALTRAAVRHAGAAGAGLWR
jgi:hypothetical protein